MNPIDQFRAENPLARRQNSQDGVQLKSSHQHFKSIFRSWNVAVLALAAAIGVTLCGSLALAQSGFGAISKAFRSRQLLFLSLGLAAAATVVARLNSRRGSSPAARSIAANVSAAVAPRRRSPAKKSGSAAARTRKSARRPKTPSSAPAA